MKKLTILAALMLAACLFSCNADEAEISDETKGAQDDWRNTITYEGSFYVNKETKLLYSQDKGCITLWDNAGDGTPLQKLTYDTSYADAMSSVEFKDINLDEYSDITVLYSKNGDDVRYNLWTWNKEDKKFNEISQYKYIYNPVISEDGTSVMGEKDLGIFGLLEMTYVFTDSGLEVSERDVTNAGEVAQAISDKFVSGLPTKKTDGVITINDFECTVYKATENGSDAAYIAYTDEGQWYFDNGCTGAYKSLSDKDGDFALGLYADIAGEAYEVCAALLGKPEGELVICDTKKGTIGDKEAVAYEFRLDGAYVCTVAKAENGVFYGTNNELTAYYVISATSEAEFLFDMEYTFTEKYA